MIIIENLDRLTNLKISLLANGIRRKALAEAVGISQAWLCLLLGGKVPMHAPMLKRIEDAIEKLTEKVG